MPIITAYYIALALFLGYVVAVGLSMAATFGITAVSRGFVTKDHRIRTPYKYAQEAVWLVCATAGGYVAAMVHGRSHPWVVGGGLVVVLVGVLWMNVWEMRQRGLGHQISMSIVSAGGVAVGFLLRLR
jgi:protein-S-isoprenylcysteine O-methyltransferase Ste14